jgi:DNA-3-methyladenine glycosylase II
MIVYGKKEMEILARRDEVLAGLMMRYGHLEAGSDMDIYAALVTHIIGQMLSNAIADRMVQRFLNLTGEITPEKVMRCSVEDLRGIGLSRRKAEYIRELSRNTLEGVYDFDALSGMSDEEVIQTLKQIRGVGTWTAEMTAEFTLGRLNIFSYDDMALKNGMKRAYGFKTVNRPRFERYRKKFSPYCSVASLYFYAANDDPDWRDL